MKLKQYAGRIYTPVEDDPLKDQNVGEVLRAAELARMWLETTETLPAEKLTPSRCFVMGYLAACKDRA
jgi:hypothetical protein